MDTYQHAQLDALGDGTRRAILVRLARRPLPVGELAGAFPVSRPAISQHLRVLKDAGLVADRVDGTRRVYAVQHDGLRALRTFFDEFWTDALTAFKAQAEAEAAPEVGQVLTTPGGLHAPVRGLRPEEPPKHSKPTKDDRYDRHD